MVSLYHKKSGNAILGFRRMTSKGEKVTKKLIIGPKRLTLKYFPSIKQKFKFLFQKRNNNINININKSNNKIKSNSFSLNYVWT